MYIFFLLGQLLSSLPPRCGRLKRIASKLQKNPRRISKEMACKIYEQAGVIVAIGPGSNKSTHEIPNSSFMYTQDASGLKRVSEWSQESIITTQRRQAGAGPKLSSYVGCHVPMYGTSVHPDV